MLLTQHGTPRCSQRLYGPWVEALFIFLLLLSPAVRAQVESGRVVGTVFDSSGAVVPGADVTVKNVESGVQRKTVTGDGGEFIVTPLQPGLYTVTVQREGFKRAQQEPFKLDVNQVLDLRIHLEVGAADQVVEVTSAEPLVETQTSSVGEVMEQTTIHNLPLNGRDFIQLAYLTPGVNAGPSGAVQQGGIPENERANGSIQANGLTATNNNFLLNGFDNNEQQIGFEVIQLPIDAIEEFKMQTSGFGADIGKGGAVVNVVMKSGTNQYHGSVYEFLRNSALDAKNYFDSASDPITPFKRNQFGATFGGRIRRDRTFFFVDYEGGRIRESETDISTVPSAAERGGDFSELLTGTIDATTGYDTGQIFNPFDLDTNGNRKPFVGNLIPDTAQDSAAKNLIALYPEQTPELAGSADNFRYTPMHKNDQNQFDIRVDHQLTGKDSTFATFDYGKVNAYNPDPLPGKAGGGSFTGNIENRAYGAGLSDVHTFSPNKVNEVKLGYSRYAVEARSFYMDEALATEMGIPGVNYSANTGGLPAIFISGFSSLGNQDWFPELLYENNYQVLDSFSYLTARHALKFGADLKLRRHSMFQTQNPRGDLNFDQQFTESLVDSSGGSALASFLLGYPIYFYRDGLKGNYGMSWKEVSGYGMDDFRVNQHLTLNLGLRYDVFTPQVEDHDRLANFDFASGEFVVPGDAGVGRSGKVITDRNNFAPRVGFAYSPGVGKLVVRGAAGIFYDLQANQSDAELAYNPTGYFESQTTQNTATTPTLRLSDGFTALVYPTVQNPSGRASAAKFDNRTSYIEEWNLNVEQSLGKDAIVQVSYVGTHGLKLAWLFNQNQPNAPLDSNFSLAANYGRPYYATVPEIAAIREEQNEANLHAHALQVRAEKRFSSGWSVLNSYTWQHTIGNLAEDESSEPQNTHDLSAERGDNAPDFREQFSSAWTYVLPFGRDQRFLNHAGLTDWIVGGWQSEGILSANSGEAITPFVSYDATNTGSGAPRPDRIADPWNFSNATDNGFCPSNRQTIKCWYNPNAFALPALAAGQSYAHQFGNARRGSLRGPANYNLDFSLFKNFDLAEKVRAQFRAEAFNILNKPEFAVPSGTTDILGAGAITSTASTSRQLQFALKVSF